MNVLFDFCLVIVSLFTGIAAGSIFMMLVECLPKIKRRQFRFTYVCICLTIAVVAATVCFFIHPDFKFILDAVLKDWIYYASICGTGFLCGLLPKVFIPFVIIVYIAFSFCCNFQLKKIFGPQYKTSQVAVNSNSVTIQEEIIAVPSGFRSINVTYEIYSLDRRMFIPISRMWICVSGVSAVMEDGSVVECGVSRNAEERLSSYRFTEYCIHSSGEKAIEIPSVHFYPAYFSVEREKVPGSLDFKVSRYF